MSSEIFECGPYKPRLNCVFEVFRNVELHQLMAHFAWVSLPSVKSRQRRPNMPLKHDRVMCFKSKRFSPRTDHVQSVLRAAAQGAKCSQHVAMACCCTVVKKRFPGHTSKHVVTRHGQKNVTNKMQTQIITATTWDSISSKQKMENLFMFGFDSKTQNPCIKNNFKTHSSIPHNITRNRARSTKYKTRGYALWW